LPQQDQNFQIATKIPAPASVAEDQDADHVRAPSYPIPPLPPYSLRKPTKYCARIFPNLNGASFSLGWFFYHDEVQLNRLQDDPGILSFIPSGSSRRGHSSTLAGLGAWIRLLHLGHSCFMILLTGIWGGKANPRPRARAEPPCLASFAVGALCTFGPLRNWCG